MYRNKLFFIILSQSEMESSGAMQLTSTLSFFTKQQWENKLVSLENKIKKIS